MPICKTCGFPFRTEQYLEGCPHCGAVQGPAGLLVGGILGFLKVASHLERKHKEKKEQAQRERLSAEAARLAEEQRRGRNLLHEHALDLEKLKPFDSADSQPSSRTIDCDLLLMYTQSPLEDIPYAPFCAEPPPLSKQARDVLNKEEFPDAANLAERLAGMDFGDRDLSPDKTAQALRMLSDYSARVPHHPYTPLGEKVTIIKARALPGYSVVLTSTYEGRKAVVNTGPYAGWALPPFTITEKNVQIWNYDLPRDNGSRLYRIENSQIAMDCEQCAASGQVTCPACNGDTRVTCPWCSGQSRIDCPSCNGSGMETQRTQQEFQEPCKWCLKDACSSMCANCHGKGVVYRTRTQYHKVSCRGCVGTGRVTCCRCSGNTWVSCSECRALGQVTCSSCAGLKRNVTYLGLSQGVRDEEIRDTVRHPEVPDDIIKLFKEEDASLVVSMSALAFPSDLPSGIRNTALKTCLQVTLAEAANEIDAECRMLRQTLLIQRTWVWTLQYLLIGDPNKKEYVATFPGGRVLCAFDNPITDIFRRRLDTAVKQWNEKRRSDATQTVQQCWEMSKADNLCKTILDRRNASIPTGLRICASVPIVGCVGRIFDIIFGGGVKAVSSANVPRKKTSALLMFLVVAFALCGLGLFGIVFLLVVGALLSK